MEEKKDKEPAGSKSSSSSAQSSDEAPDEGDRLVVAAGEGSAGAIGYDDLGQPRWTWVTEVDGTSDADEDTFDYLKALDTDSLKLADEPGATARERRRASRERGYNPYDTSRIRIKGKFSKRS